MEFGRGKASLRLGEALICIRAETPIKKMQEGGLINIKHVC